MEAVDKYKEMVDEVGHMLYVFANFKDYPFKDLVKEQGWTLENIKKMQVRVQHFGDITKQIKDELVGDGDEAKFMGRLKTAFFELGAVPYFAPSYFPVFDEALFELPSKDEPDRNKEMVEALVSVYGEEAGKVMLSLRVIVQWANMFVEEVSKMLDDVCKFVGYTPERHKQTQEATNTDCLAVEQPEPQQGAQEQQGVQQKGEVHLPDVLNTQKTKAIFDEAIKRKWMQPNGNGCYRWLGLNGYERGKQQQLVYMIGQMYGYKKGLSGNEGNYIPCKALEGLFEVSGIYSRLIKCWEAKPQSWRQAIDDMIATALQNNTASTSN